MQLCLKHLALGMAGQRGTENVLMPAVFFIEMLKRLFADFPVRIVKQLVHDRLV